jgi:NADH-quinone oxidoreductase subunit M
VAAMTLLNVFVTSLIFIYQLGNLREENAEYIGLLWMSYACIQGVFCSQHAIIFYIFFELSIIPLGLWLLHEKTEESLFATKQFVLYTSTGAGFFLIGIILCHLGIQNNSWLFMDLSEARLSKDLEIFVSFCLIIPFLIKLPSWPLHGWLPLAHTQAPTEASILLASVVLKIGGYGLLRVISLTGDRMPIFWSYILITLGLMGLIFMGLSAFVQKDWKKLIAYSSIVHMSWVVIGSGLLIQNSQHQIMIYNAIVMQLFSHGLISIALFFIVGSLSHRTNTRDIEDYRGMVQALPVFTKYITFFMLANAALPGTSGFVGEFMILIELYEY